MQTRKPQLPAGLSKQAYLDNLDTRIDKFSTKSGAKTFVKAEDQYERPSILLL